MRVDAFLAQDEDFCFGKRYRGLHTAHKIALAAARVVEHFPKLALCAKYENLGGWAYQRLRLGIARSASQEV